MPLRNGSVTAACAVCGGDVPDGRSHDVQRRLPAKSMAAASPTRDDTAGAAHRPAPQTPHRLRLPRL